MGPVINTMNIGMILLIIIIIAMISCQEHAHVVIYREYTQQ